MNEEYLNLLERIRDTLSEIQSLQEDIGELLENPAASLKELENIRDTLSEIQSLQEDTEV